MIFVSYCFVLHEFVLVTAHPPPRRSDGPPLGLVSVMGKPFVLFDVSTVASQGEFYLGGAPSDLRGGRWAVFLYSIFLLVFGLQDYFFLANARLA